MFARAATGVAVTAALAMAVPTASAQPGPQGVQRLSAAVDGNQADGDSYEPSISRNGRFVAFSSTAANLVPGDTNGSRDLFVRDLRAGTLQRIELEQGALPGASFSASGRRLAYVSGSHVFVRDLRTGETEQVDTGLGDGFEGGTAFQVSLSGNGRHAVFAVRRPTGVPAAEGSRVYLRDLEAGTTELVSQANTAAETYYAGDPVVSDDGARVAYTYTRQIPKGPMVGHVFLLDRPTGGRQVVDVSTDGSTPDRVVADPSLTADGERVMFSVYGGPLPVTWDGKSLNAYVRDVGEGTTRSIPVSGSQGGSGAAWMSADGRHAVYRGAVADPDSPGGSVWSVQVQDLETGEVRIASTAPDGSPAYADNGPAALAGDGRTVVFHSQEAGLVPDDTNGVADVFLSRVR